MTGRRGDKEVAGGADVHVKQCDSVKSGRGQNKLKNCYITFGGS